MDAFPDIDRLGVGRRKFYVNLSSKEALVRALSMLDRRLGRRRIAMMDVTREHPMVQFFHAFRRSAEKSVRGSTLKGTRKKGRAP